MDQVRKTFFDPLATTKDRIREILEGLPVGSAHPFSPERILLCRTANGIDEIDTSSYQHDFFCNAVDLGEMGETLLRRMAGFQSHLRVFDEFQITQAPSSTFSIPITSSHITILAVSERMPTYYDFCLADASGNACCFDHRAMRTFSGIVHSGDITNAMDLLQFVRIDKDTLTAKEICVFISGYSKTEITRFQGTHPALLVADHTDKVLTMLGLPPHEGCFTNPLSTDSLHHPGAIGRSNGWRCYHLLSLGDQESWRLAGLLNPVSGNDRQQQDVFEQQVSQPRVPGSNPTRQFHNVCTISNAPYNSSGPEPIVDSENLGNIMSRKGALFFAGSVTRPSFLTLENMQTIKFGTGIDFQLLEEKDPDYDSPASVLLPCIFGSRLEGPVLLATGTVPSNVPFSNERALRNYYDQLKSVVVTVDDRMTDNARNLAPPYRINALFIVQLNPEVEPMNAEEVTALLDSTNINAVTALAGPQSLVLVQAFDKCYFYRGLANRAHLDTTTLAYGSDVTQLLTSVDVEEILDPRIKRIVNLEEENTILLPNSGEVIRLHALEKLFKDLTIDRISDLAGDISAAIPQIQILLNQKDLQSLSKSLVALLSSKVGEVTGHLRSAYIEFLGSEYNPANQESAKKKARMLGELRKTTKRLETGLKPVISQLAIMMSSQTTSKRTHDLKRLLRQNQIKSNVEATKTMSFDTIAGYLEEYAEDMGVMLLKIDETPYRQLLGNLGLVTNAVMNARYVQFAPTTL
ncbi:hypothetical protein S7711_04126 [Stachybotrys chartarum IBT 7711]|uniref:Uncharacterized protein n=1 Tax=Stachybotrys chartarum (strain CBS 109288 / IBT 7711) TaxID=1280523 RepID=A0A084AR87_STACB|nr:hypothetical protein S7711_04126 [Stachybotrys chartarum IBT 7711]